MRMTQPQHQYSKTATYIVNCVYIYIFAQTKMKVLLHSQLFLHSQEQKPNDRKHGLWSL